MCHENAVASHRETSMHKSSEGHQLRQLCEQESNKLWETIKLERQMTQEKDERAVCETKLSRSKNAFAFHLETSMHKSSEGHQLRQLSEKDNLAKMPQIPIPLIVWIFPTFQILHQNLLHPVQDLSQV